jgi:hypothetical protein
MVNLQHVLRSNSFSKLKPAASARKGSSISFRSSNIDAANGLARHTLRPASKLTIVQMKLGTGVLVSWESDLTGGSSSVVPGSSNLPSGLAGLFSDINSIIGSSGTSGLQGFGGITTGPGGSKTQGPPPGYHGGGGDPAADDGDDDEEEGIRAGTTIVGDGGEDTTTGDDTSATNANTPAASDNTAGTSGSTTDSNGVITLGTIEIVSYSDNAHDLDAGTSGGTSLPGGAGDEGPATGDSGDSGANLFEAVEGGLAIIAAGLVLVDPATKEVAAAGALVAGIGGTVVFLHGVLGGNIPASDGIMPASDGIRPASDGIRPSDDSKGPGTPHSFSQLSGNIETSGRQFAIVGEATHNRSAGWLFAQSSRGARGSSNASISGIDLSLQIGGSSGGNRGLVGSGMVNLN